MNKLSIEYGFKQINHENEQLCGDHIDVITQKEKSKIIVLADGLGSGVKASILSTLTSKLISTMIDAGMSIEDCVRTVVATLPIDHSHDVAYCTFTIFHITGDNHIEIVQYENPKVIILRDGKEYDYQAKNVEIQGKELLITELDLEPGDIIIGMSDGVPYANSEEVYNYDWGPEQIADFIATMDSVGYTAKNLANMLVAECEKMYAGKPRDDVSACIIKAKEVSEMNVLFGPPRNRDDELLMLDLFFSQPGKHVVCGGTTARMASCYLDKPIGKLINTIETDIPPMSLLEGVELVTEGVLTMSRVVEYLRDYLGEDKLFKERNRKKDAAGYLYRMMIDDATKINFFVGTAINPAHQNDKLELGFNYKMKLVKELSEGLESLGKTVTVEYF